MELFFTPTFVHREAAQRVGRIIAANSPAGYVGGVGALLEFDVTARLGEIRAPTVVLAGEQDRATPVRCSEVLAARIPGASLGIIPNAGHIANVEQPEAITAALLAHLANHT